MAFQPLEYSQSDSCQMSLNEQKELSTWHRLALDTSTPLSVITVCGTF